MKYQANDLCNNTYLDILSINIHSGGTLEFKYTGISTSDMISSPPQSPISWEGPPDVNPINATHSHMLWFIGVDHRLTDPVVACLNRPHNVLQWAESHDIPPLPM